MVIRRWTKVTYYCYWQLNGLTLLNALRGLKPHKPPAPPTRRLFHQKDTHTLVWFPWQPSGSSPKLAAIALLDLHFISVLTDSSAPLHRRHPNPTQTPPLQKNHPGEDLPGPFLYSRSPTPSNPKTSRHRPPKSLRHSRHRLLRRSNGLAGRATLRARNSDPPGPARTSASSRTRRRSHRSLTRRASRRCRRTRSLPKQMAEVERSRVMPL